MKLKSLRLLEHELAQNESEENRKKNVPAAIPITGIMAMAPKPSHERIPVFVRPDNPLPEAEGELTGVVLEDVELGG